MYRLLDRQYEGKEKMLIKYKAVNNQVIEITFTEDATRKRWLRKKERIKLTSHPNLVRCNEGRLGVNN